MNENGEYTENQLLKAEEAEITAYAKKFMAKLKVELEQWKNYGLDPAHYLEKNYDADELFEAMLRIMANISMLPEYCHSINRTTGELIVIKRGEHGFYKTELNTKYPERNREIVDFFNVRDGISKAVEEAMICGVMFGWDTQAANIESYDDPSKDTLKSKGDFEDMRYDPPIKAEMHIHSLDGEMREATILEKVGDNDYLAEYNGVQCHAIFNPFAGAYYVDDKYGIIKNSRETEPDFDMER